ncbi:MAG: hypothetical protein IPO08_19790 [Xanthomonadales bacterium]|nr:hypothetical protein [Xanthomonadales bacterium]
MTWLAIKLLMDKALERLLGLFKLALAHPWQAALILAVCALFWQHRAISQRDDTIAQQTALIADMQAKAKAARAQSVTIAKDSDDAHETRLADNRSGTIRYIERNRVRTQACVSAPAEGEAAGASESAAAVPLVAMSEPDVKACGDLHAYAWSAYEWGQAQIKAGLAD